MRIATFILGLVFSLPFAFYVISIYGIIGGLSNVVWSDTPVGRSAMGAALLALIGMAFTLETPAVSAAAYLLGVGAAVLTAQAGPGARDMYLFAAPLTPP